MSKKKTLIGQIFSGKFSVLLLLFVAAFLILPLLSTETGVLERSVRIFNVVVLLSALRAISVSHRYFIFIVILSLVNLALTGTNLLVHLDSTLSELMELVFRLLYYLCILGSIMRYVLDESPVTGNKIAGAVTVYIIIGLAWATIYSIFYYFEPTSFGFPSKLITDSGAPQAMWAMYFSFTTLTTLGYGDILPQHSSVQAYAILEAAVGQIFLAVIIARLVALQIIHKSDK